MRKFRMEKIFLGLFFATIFCLLGCGPRLAKGPATASEILPPDSLRVKFSIDVDDSVNGSHTLSAVLFAVPYKRYRLEFSGPMGIGIASVLWTDAKWTLLLSQQKSYATGMGQFVGGFAGIPLFDMHRIAALFWGETFPQNAVVDSTRDSAGVKIIVGKNSLGIPFRAERNADGRVTKIVEGKETLTFEDYAEFNDRIAPAVTRAYRDGKNVLTVKIKRVNTDAEWGDATWRLPIPDSYEKIRY